MPLQRIRVDRNAGLCGHLPAWAQPRGGKAGIVPLLTLGTGLGSPCVASLVAPPLPDWADVLISLKETAWASSSSFSSWNATNVPCTSWAGELSQPRQSHKHSIYTTISLCLSPQGLLVIQSLGSPSYSTCPVESCTPAQRSPTACPSSRPSQESPSSPTR